MAKTRAMEGPREIYSAALIPINAWPVPVRIGVSVIRVRIGVVPRIPSPPRSADEDTAVETATVELMATTEAAAVELMSAAAVETAAAAESTTDWATPAAVEATAHAADVSAATAAAAPLGGR